MLGSTLVNVRTGISMAAVGAPIGEKISSQIATAGWAVPDPTKNPAPEMGTVRTVSANPSALSQAELQAVVDSVQKDGEATSLPGGVGTLLGLSNGQDIPAKGKQVKTNDELKVVFVFTANNSLYVLLADRFATTGTIYLTNVNGAYLQGYNLSAGAPQPIPASTPDFVTQKQFWESQLGQTTLASKGAGS